MAHPNRLTSGLLLAALAFCATTAAQSETGQVKAEQKISDTDGGFTPTLAAADQFGVDVEWLGDLDGDGIGDLATGALNDGANIGAVYILFLDLDGSVKSHQKINGSEGGFIGTLDAADRFGVGLACLGDLDGDGVPDLAVGAREDDDGAADAGAVWILFLQTDGTVKAHKKISATSGGFGGALGAGDFFGNRLSALGDLDGDGNTDLAASASLDDDGGTDRGAVWILLLNADGTVKSEQKISDTDGGFATPLEDGDRFGQSVELLGDLENDGVSEIAVGVRSDDDGGSARGAVFLLSLNTDGTVAAERKISDTAGGFTGGLADSDFFGESLAALGDLDGDGVPDLAAGASGDDDGGTVGTDRGAIWILFLNSDGTVKGHQKISQAEGGLMGELDVAGNLGEACHAMGDHDGDGIVDLAVGAPLATDGASTAGEVWLLFLQGPPLTPFDLAANALSGKAGLPTIFQDPTGGADDKVPGPIVVVPNTSGNTVAVSIVVPQAGAEAVVLAAQEFATGFFPTEAASDLFDNDEFHDVVTSNFFDNSVSLLLGNGDGTFATAVDIAMPFDGQPVGLCPADLDGDTFCDVVVAGDAGVTVFFGDGLGSLVPLSFAAVPLLTDLAVGDVDGDTDIDVITASGQEAFGPGIEIGIATVLINDGSGNLTPTFQFAAGHAIASVLLGDVDLDTDLDAVVALHEYETIFGDAPRGTIELYLGDGAGSFTKSPTFAGVSLPNADGIHPTYGSLGDVDGDGFPDIVYTSADSIAYARGTYDLEQPPVLVTQLLNDRSGGFSCIEEGTAYAGKGVTPLLRDIAPLTPDGLADRVLVFSADTVAGLDVQQDPTFSSYLAVLGGQGGGTVDDLAPDQESTGVGPGDAAVGDVNGDDAQVGGGLDLVVPNLVDDSLSVLLGDGNGGAQSTVTITDVDDLDPGGLPPGDWIGGPRLAYLAHLDGGTNLDAVTYNEWSDTAAIPSPNVFASASLFLGDGTGGFTKAQNLPFTRGGDLAVGDVTLDGDADVVVTQRLGPGTDQLLVFAGQGDGTVSLTPTTVSVPAGQLLSGGIAIADADGNAEVDVITTVVHSGTGDGSLLVFENNAGVLTAQLHALAGTWTEVRSLDVGDVSNDTFLDVAIGAEDGALFLAESDGAGNFVAGVTNATATSAGGGALRIADVDGDGLNDIVAAESSDLGDLDQAFVRVLRGAPNGTFTVTVVGGMASEGVTGSNRPLLADMNHDGLLDMALSHGRSDAVSIRLNGAARWETYGPGKPGTGGITPTLRGSGSTRVGSSVSVQIANGLGGTQALLLIGLGREAILPLPAVQVVLLDLPLPLAGAAGVPGAGALAFPPTPLPDDVSLAGAEITMQAILLDTGAGPPSPLKFSATNGLSMTLLK